MEDVQNLITTWLEKKDYDEGVFLFLKYGKNKNLNRLFQRPKTNYSSAKLENELKKLLKKNTVSLKKVTIDLNKKVEKSVQTSKKHEVKPEQLKRYPQELKQAIKERNECYRIRDRLHAQLSFITTIKKRFIAQQEMIRCQRRLIHIWNALDYYDQHKVILPEFQNKSNGADLLKLKKRESNLLTYVSRYRNKKDSKSIEKFNKYSDELHEVKKKLGML